jgi:hypothetical protein
MSLFGAGPAFAGSLFEELVVSLGFDSLGFDSPDFDSLAGFEGSLDALSAWAAFLYDSLR